MTQAAHVGMPRQLVMVRPRKIRPLRSKNSMSTPVGECLMRIEPAGMSMSNHTDLAGRFLTSFMAVCLCSLTACAQDAPKGDRPPPEGQRAPAAPKAGNVADPADLEAFFD